MDDLKITFATVDYLDRTRALVDGTVKPDGLKLHVLPLDPAELFRRVARAVEFDVAEMSFSTYTNLISKNDRRYIAIPVFPSRFFRHSGVYLHAAAGVRRPQDLRGKRVGVSEYQMTAALWQRAFLMHDYGVMPREMNWFQGGLTTPGYLERNPIPDPPGVSIRFISDRKSLEETLADGDIDALFSPRRPPALLDGSGRVSRLFPNFVEVEKDYFKRTGFFPIMHLIVLRRDLYEKNRWIATSLLNGFKRAQRIGWQRLTDFAALAVMAPWLTREVEETVEVMGPEPWPYGFPANYKILKAMCQYSHEQGLSNRRLDPEELFAPETHEQTD